MWLKEEEEYLLSYYSSIDNIILEKKLNKNIGCIVRKANSMGLRKSKEYISLMKRKINPKLYWNDRDLDYLVNNYKQKSNSEISDYLKKTKRSVCRKLKELNLRRTKDEKDSITSRFCKKSGRDLNFEFVKNEALKYSSKQEFYILDSGSYSASIRNGWYDEICKHMRKKKQSIPQLMLKDILEKILKTECSFNNRKIIYPKEIDCYFEEYKMGFEYDGRYFHSSPDIEKIKICENKGLKIFIIDENNDIYRNYERNIKTQLIKILPEINKITNLSININDIIEYKPVIKFDDVLDCEEIEFVFGKKMSLIKSENVSLYNRLKRYKFNISDLGIINDDKKIKKFKSLEDYMFFLKKTYNSFTEASKIEHVYRNAIKYNISILEIKSIWT